MKPIYPIFLGILLSAIIFFTLNYIYPIQLNNTEEIIVMPELSNSINKKSDISNTSKKHNLFYKVSDGIFKIYNKDFLPYHPIRFKRIKNKIFYLIEGKLYYLDLEKETSFLLDLENNLDLVDIEYDNYNKIFLLDKSNKIYIYNLKKNTFEKYFTPYSFPMEPDPQIVKMLFIKNSLYVLDPSRNQIWKVHNNVLEAFFKKDPLVWLLKKEDRNISDSNSFYFQNNIFNILKRKNIIDVYQADILRESLDINIKNKYGYLGIYSEEYNKNVYLVGGYNGSIVSMNKLNKDDFKLYTIKLDQEVLPVYDFLISENKYHILAGNYLLIKDSLSEFENIKNDKDILGDYFKRKGLSNYKIPIDINKVKLPDNAGLFPGARRLYRYGTHEGIDFFTESENKIFIDKNTKVISCEKGRIIRIDQDYQELTPHERMVILQRCKDNKSTSNEDANLLKGRQIIIQHENNIHTSYCHLNDVNKDLKVGDNIDKGQFIGFVGNSGTSDGVSKNDRNIHLHFEVHIDDNSKDFIHYLGKSLSIEETIQIYNYIFN